MKLDKIRVASLDVVWRVSGSFLFQFMSNRKWLYKMSEVLRRKKGLTRQERFMIDSFKIFYALSALNQILGRGATLSEISYVAGLSKQRTSYILNKPMMLKGFSIQRSSTKDAGYWNIIDQSIPTGIKLEIKKFRSLRGRFSLPKKPGRPQILWVIAKEEMPKLEMTVPRKKFVEWLLKPETIEFLKELYKLVSQMFCRLIKLVPEIEQNYILYRYYSLDDLKIFLKEYEKSPEKVKSLLKDSLNGIELRN